MYNIFYAILFFLSLLYSSTHISILSDVLALYTTELQLFNIQMDLLCLVSWTSQVIIQLEEWGNPPRFRANHFSQQTIFPSSCLHRTPAYTAVSIIFHEPTLNRLSLSGSCVYGRLRMRSTRYVCACADPPRKSNSRLKPKIEVARMRRTNKFRACAF